jgi:Fe-S-cluster containining protein
MIADFRETRRLLDENVVTAWMRGARKTGKVACDTCKRAACCSLQVTAYLPEVQIIAERVRNDPDMMMRIEAWTVRYLAIPGEVRGNEAEVFRRRMTCPFFIGGKCAIYEDRPISCRLHFVLAEDESGCQFDADPTATLTKIDQRAVHLEMHKVYGLPRVMAPALLAMLRPNSPNGRKAAAAAEEDLANITEALRKQFSD